jgi:hypothetical protein
MTDTTTEAPKAQPQTDEILNALLGKMTDLHETKPNLKVMVFSDPDGGKSTFAGTADNNLIIDAEDGLTSLRNMPDRMGKGSKRYPYKSFEGFEIVAKYLADRNPAFDWCEVVSIDTLSELHKKGLAETTEREHKKSPTLVNRYRAETEHHTENNEHIRRIVAQLKDLDRDLILLAHSRIVEPKNKDAKIFPDFSEKLATALVALVDICIYIEKREVNGEIKRVFRFRTDSNIMTKCRIGGLPDEAEDVTWPKLKAAFERHLANQQ